ncbi:M1 family metallopeptidase [Streptomyces sp. NPDC059894]|uniref:M1 family metallopeptidase n=1 Tax=unclassified Streptomyces TaxID=2593676 RepID=UPI003646D06B
MTRLLSTAITAVAATVALTLPAQAVAFDPQPGAAGAGDPLFPTLGNGGYDVQHYDLAFDFTPVTYDFTGTMTITAKATQDLSSFNLDIDSYAIDQVTVNGKAATWAISKGQSGQELTVTPAGDGLHDRRLFKTVITYHGNGRTKPVGAVGWRYMSDGGFVSAAQASRADTFAPVNDTTMDKATWSFHLTAPDGWTPAANGVATGTHPASDARTTWDFRLDSPMAPELLGISVGRQTRITGKARGVRLRSYVPDDQVERYRPIVERTGEQIAWLEDTLGVRFPFDTYGVQIVRDGYSDALENQTLSLFGPNWFADSATSTTYTNVMIHELTHQWFGDSVTPTTWQSAWLNEGPAVYYAAVWAEQQGGTTLEEKMHTAYTKLDAVRKSDGPPGLPTELGGFNIYDGAAVVLYALHERVGQEKFDAIIKSWLIRHRDSNADTQDFIDNAVQVTHDSSLRPFLEDWLFAADNPSIPGHPDWS